MEKQIKVAMIPDETRLIINAGKDFFKIGDKIEVYEEGIKIEDPDEPEEIIGRYDFVKDSLVITNVYADYSVARKEIEKKHSTIFEIASPMLQGGTYIDYESINVKDSDNLKLDQKDTTIKKGDLVKLV